MLCCLALWPLWGVLQLRPSAGLWLGEWCALAAEGTVATVFLLDAWCLEATRHIKFNAGRY
jgi:hypothetical protein